MWIGWILSSCAALSAYDLCKKASVRGNAAFPVLLVSTTCAWLTVTAGLLATGAFAGVFAVTPRVACALLFKSLIVGASWTATYQALRTLPITCAAPIRATGPLWTLVGAIALYGEIPTALQALGIASVLFGCFLFARSTAAEGIRFWQSRAILLAFLGTLLGSCSALYDKRLLKGLGIPTGTVLWWFLGGMILLYAVPAVLEFRRDRRSAAAVRFDWRWTIPLVGVLLAASDAFYFTALAVPDSRISILSVIRRASVIITFLAGGALFRETNLRRKAIALAAILIGVVILCLA